MKKKPKPEWTEARLLRLLERRYAGSAWAFLRHVRSGTGAIDPRTVDAMAMSLWPSRGLHLYGFEIKVSTTDWLRELREPQKAEDIFKFCDFWYIVGAPDAVNREKLPKTWGLLEPDGQGNLRTTVEAPLLKPNVSVIAWRSG